MNLQLKKAETSVILVVFIQDSSSTTGAGLGSLDQTSSIVGGYTKRNGTGVALAVDENVTTEGTYQAPSTAAQVRIGTPANMTAGVYELHFHNDLFTTADYLVVSLGGATNMAPLLLEIQLTDFDLNTTLTDASIVNEWETQSQADPTGFHVNVLEVNGTAQTANDNGADINEILIDTNSLNDTKIPNTLNTTALGNIGIDWANVENPTTALDLSATDIQLVDTTTTNTDMRGTDSANTVVPMTAATSQTEHDATQSAISGLNDVAATDIVSAGAITTLSGAVVNVDTVDSVTALTAAAIDSILDEQVDLDGATPVSLRQAQRLFMSVLTGVSSGGGTSTVTFKKVSDGTTTRLSATVDAQGNRTAVGTRDLTA